MKFSKKGDGGETSLLGGQRVPKFDPRPDTYGTLDEASSVLGVARAMTKNGRVKDILLAVQKDLLTLGAELSTLPDELSRLTLRIGEGEVRRIENLIDDLQREITLKNEFIYPGESASSAQIRKSNSTLPCGLSSAAQHGSGPVTSLVTRPWRKPRTSSLSSWAERRITARLVRRVAVMGDR